MAKNSSSICTVCDAVVPSSNSRPALLLSCASRGQRGGKCCRRPLSISFADIGWNWIVQPKEFEAFYCKGRCNDSKGHFANTHALMQSILKIKGHNVSRPCCAPKSSDPSSCSITMTRTPRADGDQDERHDRQRVCLYLKIKDGILVIDSHVINCLPSLIIHGWSGCYDTLMCSSEVIKWERLI
ncbi:hypothetical protein TNCT_502461 [Trichonephila clavata]|uniref:TGF-beta family profile domain-containing protein n=1 Tax=Trichonephila clavata TaxID=2740835 RepID=A0A8X6KRC2_TRICU|nr:hypothetical protein TNCT_502461 [Trichonephila clavata]